MYLLKVESVCFHSLSDKSGIKIFITFLFTDQPGYHKCKGVDCYCEGVDA